MKITDKLLSIPPYLSTSWFNISALFMENHPELSIPTLAVSLRDGQKVNLPELAPELLEIIFENHARHLNRERSKTGISLLQLPAKVSLSSWMPDWISSLPLKFLGEPEDLSLFMKHNPEINGVIPIPDEILSRVVAISRAILRPSDRESLPVPEGDCRCPHCQIARAIQFGFEQNEDLIDEPISDEDLQLGLWIIKPMPRKTFEVTNSLDSDQTFTVSLGKKVKCNCGQSHCEHIKVVLRS